MKRLLYKLGTKTALTAVMLLLVFAPFQGLVVRAQSVGVAASGGAGVSGGSANNNTGGNGTLFGTCGITKGNSISSCITDAVYVFTIGIGSFFAYGAAYFFDIAIQISLNSASYALTFVSTGWTTARDLGNMAFLFILIYIAFTIIFKAETSGTMSLLAGVVVVALLVNFSFFFTRLVIDAGNILSIQFYNAISAPSIATTMQSTPVSGTIAGYVGPNANTKDLTASIMQVLKLQNLLNNTSFKQTQDSSVALVILLVFLYLMAAVILWILTVAFITNGIKFLFRVVVLWFLIIASPLAFVAAAVQKGGMSGGYFKQWRELLFAHAFYPVAFMFIFLMLVNFCNTLGSSLVGGVFDVIKASDSNTITTGAIIGSIVSIGIRLFFVVAILFVGMRASDKISVMGSVAANKAGNWVGGKFFGTYGAAGRNTLGLGGHYFGQTQTMKKWAANDMLFGRNLQKGFNKLGSASFDVRAPLKAAGVKDVYGLNLKDANKGGYKKGFDEKVKAREKEADSFGITALQKEQNEIAAKQRAEKEFSKEKENIAKQVTDAKDLKATADKTHQDSSKELEEINRQHNAAKTEADDAAKDAENLNKVKGAASAEAIEAKNKYNEAQNKLEALRVARAAKNTEVQKHKESRDTFTKNLNDAEKQEKERAKKEESRAKELIPEDNKKRYGRSIEGKGGLGILGNMSRLGFYIPAADKEAAAKLRKGKSSDQQALEAMKKVLKEQSDKDKAGEEKAKDAKTEAKEEAH